MWILVFFDLPVLTREQRRAATKFREMLLGIGFSRVQFSVYARWCVTDKSTESVMRRVRGGMPDDGMVRILKLTDDRWARSVCLVGINEVKPEAKPPQLVLFPPPGAVKQPAKQTV
jgi:CRISPR-associated protein Cas2